MNNILYIISIANKCSGQKMQYELDFISPATVHQHILRRRRRTVIVENTRMIVICLVSKKDKTE